MKAKILGVVIGAMLICSGFVNIINANVDEDWRNDIERKSNGNEKDDAQLKKQMLGMKKIDEKFEENEELGCYRNFPPWRVNYRELAEDFYEYGVLDQEITGENGYTTNYTWDLGNGTNGAGATNSTSKTIAIYPISNPTLSLEWQKGHGSEIKAIEICDIDNDGKKDLVLGNEEGILYAMEYKEGQYCNRWESDYLGSAILGIAIEDIDGDNVSEIIIGTSANHIYIFDGPTGELEGDFDVPSEGWGAHYMPIATGDIDNDGTIEIITKDGYYYWDGEKAVWHGYLHVFDGKTYEQEYVSDDLGSDVCSLTTGDIDDDGLIEIIAGTGRWIGGDYTNCHIYIFAYNGTTYEQRWKSADLKGIYGLAVSDIDSDGITEILCQNVYGTIYVFDGITKEQEWVSSSLGGSWGDSLRTEDIDADGVVEIVVGTSDYLYIFDGITKEQEWKSENLGYLIYGLAVGDADNDGVKEIVCANRDGYIYVFNGATKEEEWREDAGGEGVSVADIDNDGVIEIIAGSAYNIYALNGITKEHEWVSNLGTWVDASQLIDVDNDGEIEIVVLTWNGFIYIFNGITKEQEWKSEQMGDAGGSIYVENSLCVGDVDNDGINEIIVGTSTKVANGEGGYIYVYDGVTKELEWMSEYLGDDSTAGGDSFGLTIGDVDDDGVTEIVTNVDGIIYVFDGISHSQEWASEYLGYGVWGSDLVVDDVDGDGTQEIITDGSGFIYVFAGTDHTQEWKSENIGSVYGLVVNDIDSDGVKEIVAGTWNGFIYVFGGVEHDLELQSDDLGCAIQDLVIGNVDNDNQIEIVASGNGYLYVFGVTGETTLSVYTDRPRYYIGEEIIVRASFSHNGEPLTGAQISGEITNNGEIYQSTLYDDGRGTHGDAYLDDGIYSARLASPEIGFPTGETRTYTIEVIGKSGELYGEASTTFQYGGWPSSRLTVEASIEDLTAPFDEFYKGDTISIKAVVKDSQDNPYDSGTVKTILYLPDYSQEELILEKTIESGEYATEYVLPREGPYTIDVSATSDYEHGDYFSPGYDTDSIFVYRGVLSLTKIDPPEGAYYKKYESVPIKIKVTREGNNIDDAIVTALIAGKYIDLTYIGNGEYRGYFTPYVETTYPLYVKAEGIYYPLATMTIPSAFTVVSESVSLQDKLQDFADYSDDQLSCMKNNMGNARTYADYFYNRMEHDKLKMSVELFFDIVGMGMAYKGGTQVVANILDKQHPSAGLVAHLSSGLGTDPPSASLKELIGKMAWKELEEGHITSCLTGVTYNKIAEYMARGYVADGINEIKEEAIIDWLCEDVTNGDTFKWLNNLYTWIDMNRDTYIPSSLNYALDNLPGLSPEEEQMIIENIERRNAANIVLRYSHFCMNNMICESYLRCLQEDNDWLAKLGNFLIVNGAWIIVGLVIDGPGWVVLLLKAAETACRIMENYKKLEFDAQMFHHALDSMVSGGMLSVQIYENTIGGFDAAMRKEFYEYPQGAISEAKHYTKVIPDLGNYKWIEKEAYSNITIQNTGTENTLFVIGAEVSTKDGYWRWSGETPTEENVCGITLNPGETATVKVKHPELSDKLDKMRFYLLAYPSDGSGVFLVDETDYMGFDNPERVIILSQWGSTTYAGASTLSPDDNETSVGPYPISSIISSASTKLDYTLSLFVENPFSFPLATRITQDLPESVQFVSVNEEGMMSSENISWSFILQPHEHKILNVTFLPLVPPNEIVTFVGAIMQFYDPIQNQTVLLSSDTMKLVVKAPFLASGFVSPVLFCNRENNAEVTITNLQQAEMQPVVSIILSDFNGSLLYVDEQQLIVPSNATAHFNLTFIPSVAEGIYNLNINVSSGNSSVTVFSTLVSVIEEAPPSLPHLIWGIVKDSYGNEINDATVTVINTRTGEWLTNTTYQDEMTGNGTYAIDISNLEGGWQDGDLINITATKTGYTSGSTSLIINGSLGSQQAPDIILIYDTTKPTSSIDPIIPYCQTSIPFVITATASDAETGVANVELFYRYSPDNYTWSSWALYETDNEAPWNWSFNAPAGYGYYQFYSIATDNTSNEEDAPGTADAIAGVDTTTPVTTHSLSGTIGDNDWYVSNVEITLDATDDTSGVDYTNYRIDGGSWNTYTGTFTVTSDGEYIIEYYSVDNAGNEEQEKNFTIKIDKTKPETTHSLNPSSPDGENGWYVSNVTVMLDANDDISGVNKTKYKIDGGNWKEYTKSVKITEDGNHTVKYYSMDDAGNEEGINSINIKIDKIKPTVSIEEPERGLYLFGRRIFPCFSIRIIGKITIKVDCQDETSGIEKVEFYIDDELKETVEKEPYEWKWDERAFFRHSIKVIAYGKAGNTASDEIDVIIFNI